MLEDIKKANPDLKGSTIPSTTTANVLGVSTGKFTIAFSITDTTAEGWEGQGYFKSPVKNIRNLAALYPMAMQIAVREDSGIKSVEQLKGKRISPAAKGTSSDIEAQRLFAAYGVPLNDVRFQYTSFEDAANMMIDGQIDAMIFTTAFPAPSIINVSSQRPIKLLSLSEDKVKELTKFKGLEPYTMPTGLYKGVDHAVKTVAARTHLIVRDDMADDVAYRIVKTIAENFKKYPGILKSMEYAKLEDMGKDVGIPLHPGARKYYKERGWIK
jgi:TRAP transporter TAXI family solute receptor